MPVLHVISDQPGAGKTCLIGALLQRLAQEGQVAAYCRPFSSSPGSDADAAFFAQYLPGLDPGAPPVPAPQPLPRPGQAQAAAQGAAETVAGLAAARLVLVEGPDLSSAAPLAQDLAARLEARVVLVLRYTPSLTAQQAAQACAAFGPRLEGVVINGVTRHRRHHVQEQLAAPLRAQGLPVLGAMPEDRAMLAVTVQQVADHLGGQWAQEPPDTGAWVERFLIGGNIMDSGTGYLGRLPNQAVITRTARPDIQLASLTPNTRCLVLTGGGQPAEYIRVEARKREVPLVLVEGDTLAAVQALEGLLDRASPHSGHKLERFGQLMREHLDGPALDRLLR